MSRLKTNNLQLISNIRRKPTTDLAMFNRNNMNLSVMNKEQTILSSRAPHKMMIRHQNKSTECKVLMDIHYFLVIIITR